MRRARRVGARSLSVRRLCLASDGLPDRRARLAVLYGGAEARAPRDERRVQAIAASLSAIGAVSARRRRPPPPSGPRRPTRRAPYNRRWACPRRRRWASRLLRT